jgi:hypothetical protein
MWSKARRATFAETKTKQKMKKPDFDKLHTTKVLLQELWFEMGGHTEEIEDSESVKYIRDSILSIRKIIDKYYPLPTNEQ